MDIAIWSILAALTGTPGDAENSNRANQVVCRRTVETGSLVRGRRACHTRAAWERISEAQARGARRVVDDLRTRHDGEGSGFGQVPSTCANSQPC